MSDVNKINDAVQHQPLRDFLRGGVTQNLGNKNVYSAQNSLIHPSMSTAGDFAVNGVVATRAASSTMFTITPTVTIPIGAGAAFVCCLNAAGSGIAYPTNVLTSAQVSSAGGGCANILASDDLVMPAIPDTMCPVGIYTVAAGSVSHVAGSSSFSLVDSAAGSHLFTQRLNLKSIS
jgi:hypothetical protein